MSAPTAPATPGLRERKKAARHAAFVDAARALVLDRSLDGVTIEDICERVGVSPRTFFNYFASKEDAVLGLGIEDVDRRAITPELAEQFASGGPTGRLVDDLTVLAAAILADPVAGPHRVECVLELVQAEPRLFLRELTTMEARRVWLETLFERREQAHPTGTSSAVIGATLMTLVRATAELWTAAERRGDPVDYLPITRDQLRRLVLTDTPDAATQDART